MQIDIAYILAAGKGTRMLDIGKVLPKPLWPIYDKTLLELQVDWCLSLGIRNIYINTHYLAELIHKEIAKIEEKKKIKIKILYEDPLLDSGGNVHNLASQVEVSYFGKVLIVNADQFYFFDNKYFQQALHSLSKLNAQAILFGLEVNKDENYNEVVLNNQNKLIEITKPLRDRSFYTYSGLGIVDLSKLDKVKGISKFFDTVAEFKKKDVYFLNPVSAEYWDFGTFELYIQSIFKIQYLFEQKDNIKILDFLLSTNACDLNKISKTGYENFIYQKAVDLNLKGNFKENYIVYNGVETLIR